MTYLWNVQYDIDGSYSQGTVEAADFGEALKKCRKDVNLVGIVRVDVVVEAEDGIVGLMNSTLSHVDKVRRAKELLGNTSGRPGWGWRILGKILGIS